MTVFKRIRLIWIDGVLADGLWLNRADICEAFEISTPQASEDLRAFITRWPDLIAYNRSGKFYFRPDLEKAAFSAALRHRCRLLIQQLAKEGTA
jgi:hypothetical protein